MTSPAPSAHGGWSAGNALPPNLQQQPTTSTSASQPAQQQAQQAAMDPSARPMSLKVQYAFGMESRQFCLARWPHTLQIRATQLDANTTIGVVDLAVCLQAMVQSSPDLVQSEKDYALYAVDYSEDDFPLVGQGPLSSCLDAANIGNSSGVVYGRVGRNAKAMLSGGPPEILEVQFKLNAMARTMQPVGRRSSVSSRHGAPGTPMDSASQEWANLMQSGNMSFGQNNGGVVNSPAMGPTRMGTPSFFPELNSQSFNGMPNASTAGHGHQRTGSMSSMAPQQMPQIQTTTLPPRRGTSSRPGSRAGSRSRKEPTGRPRGRPRKRPVDNGNTSAAEEATDGESGVNKPKRAKTTQAEWTDKAPFGSAPNSLRVAASTSGSLRTLRPAASGGGIGASHLQEVPRAPTPVPQAGAKGRSRDRNALRRQSFMESHTAANSPPYETAQLVPQAQDARSPTESVSQSMYHGYSSEDNSPADLGSSPPVPTGSAYYTRTEAGPSSPLVFPTLPSYPVDDSGFMSGGLEDMGEMDYFQPELMHKTSKDAPVSLQQEGVEAEANMMNLEFQEVEPGPMDKLPVNSIFKPHGAAMSLNRGWTPTAETTGVNVAGQQSQGPNRLAAPRQLTRSNTAPGDMIRQTTHAGPSSLSTAAAVVPTIENDQAQMPTQTSETSSLDQSAAASQAANEETVAAMLAPPTRRPTQSNSRSKSASLPAEEPNRGREQSRPATSRIETAPAPTRPSEAPSEMDICPPSDADPSKIQKPSKNITKKLAIKEKLERAIATGTTPTFCKNCGAIETPTWRKVWTRDCHGSPEFPIFSDKPGHITAIEILERDDVQRPTKYREVKKSLGNDDDRILWTEIILCNPCGIWLSKFKQHRPEERWSRDAGRLGQNRSRKPDGKPRRSASKKARTNDQLPLTSDAGFPTDILAPPSDDEDDSGHRRREETQSRQGSTHSRYSGTAPSPVVLEEDFGETRRLLFPSPQRQGASTALGEISANVVKLPSPPGAHKPAVFGKDVNLPRPGTPTRHISNEDMDDLFGTPRANPAVPWTPKSKNSNGSFKTPSRPTPSHRPITRSVSKSIRSHRSEDLVMLLSTHTPTKSTPRRSPRHGAALPPPQSPSITASARRRKLLQQQQHAAALAATAAPSSFTYSMSAPTTSLQDAGVFDNHMSFDTPFSSGLNKLLSEANDFTTGSPSHGLGDLQMDGLDIDIDEFLAGSQATEGGMGGFMDMVAPSSPGGLNLDQW